MDSYDLSTLDYSSSYMDAWPGVLYGLAPYDPTHDVEKAPLYAKKNLLHAARFEFRARLADGPNGERQYSRQKIGEPGLLIKTTLPADIYAWPALMVRSIAFHMCHCCTRGHTT